MGHVCGIYGCCVCLVMSLDDLVDDWSDIRPSVSWSCLGVSDELSFTMRATGYYSYGANDTTVLFFMAIIDARNRDNHDSIDWFALTKQQAT